MLAKRPFGKTPFETTLIGFGAGQIGDERLSDLAVNKLLNELLDEGINVIDTARGYGLSEQRIGRFISHRRDEFILSTKVGYSVAGLPNWTYETVIAGVELARQTLQSDQLDIVHLHSCPHTLIEKNGLLDALQETVTKGWVKVPAYSGDNEDLRFVLSSGQVGSVQTSVNLFDQWAIDSLIPAAKEKGLGILSKRSLGNAPWRFAKRPIGHYGEPYWERCHIMDLQTDVSMLELALRFTVFETGVDCALIGTTDINHLRHNINLLQKGPLPADLLQHVRDSFYQHDDNWVGLT